MLAGLQHSGGGHCRTCLTDRLHQDRFHRLCEPSTAQIVDLSQTEDHGKRSLPQAYLSTGGFHSCFTWRHALLQAVRTFEQYTSKEKAKHGEGHMSLTKVGNSSSPSSTEFCPADASDLWREDFPEPAPKTSNAFAAGMVDKHTASKLRQVKSANTK